MFFLQNEEAAIYGHGVAKHVEPGPLATLDARLRAHFAGADPHACDLVVGAIPFSRSARDFLYSPRALETVRSALPHRLTSHVLQKIVSVPTAHDYARIVRHAVELLTCPGSERLRKVVLARSLQLTFDRPVDPAALVSLLAQDTSVTSFLSRLPGKGQDSALLVGATPELLLDKRGASIRSHPLAGSARRHSDPVADRAAASRLERSEKDRREHELVVGYIMDLLNPLCGELAAPDGTQLRSTATMWHLGTDIRGVLKDNELSTANLLALLHPTPAVGGMPLQAALDVIASLEPSDREFYAGAIGWADANGDGAWYVTLRCAEIVGPRVTVHAGAGIVPGSDPDAEVAETAAKFGAVLQALGLDEQGLLAGMLRDEAA